MAAGDVMRDVFKRVCPIVARLSIALTVAKPVPKKWVQESAAELRAAASSLERLLR